VRIVVDTCGGRGLVRWLRAEGHDVRSIEEEQRTRDDRSILQLAASDDRVLITLDKDFGPLVFVEGMTHAGVILLRLDDERWQAKVEAVERALRELGDRLIGEFVVVTETTVRISRRGRRRQR
jgi:predicted nuclease of predicted toxin-antitoxin system